VSRPVTAGHLALLYGIAAIAWLAAAALCLLIGSTGNFGWPSNAIYDVRSERILLASLVGAALAGGGVAYQAVLRNPLADPYLLGASSGATLATYLWTMPAAALGMLPLVIGQQGFAFAGALAAVAVVLVLAGGSGRLEPTRAILVGVIVSAVCGSVLMLLISVFTTPAGGGGALSLLFGSIRTSLTTTEVAIAAALALAAGVILAAIAGSLNVAALGEEEAESMGVGVNRLRWLALVVASLLVASAVAVGGPIGFIGLIAPHVGRLIVGPDNRRLLPIALAIGAILLAGADTATRALSSSRNLGTVLPVGVLTGLLGGPFFLVLLWGRRGRTYE
jgi:iron complex transport system permease protein